jgi:ribonuclease D
MTAALIVDQGEFDDLCAHIRKSGLVAFDTEFISEYTFRPELCLLQFATKQQCVAVDPFEVHKLDAWWELMADEKTEILIHGGREEVRFCLTHTGKPPGKLWDVQIAEGLRGRSFPLGYEALVRRVVGKSAHGRETRSDWRRRPLTEKQIAYALDDVRHMPEIWERQRKSLKELKRLDWVASEFQRFIEEVQAERSPDSWQRLSGLQRLKPRELAVAREIYRWRDREAESKDRPARKILRDDLIIELARRQPDSAEDLLGIRDMNRSEYKKAASNMLKHIAAGLAVPDDQLPTLPQQPEDDKSHDEHVLGQLLGLALASRCAELNVAVPLVGKAADLRHLVRWHVYGEKTGEPPRLTQGWRAEVCGDLLTDVLDGKIALRVADPQSDHPLNFERRRSRDAGAEKS